VGLTEGRGPILGAIAGAVAILAVVLVVLVVLVGGGSDYTVHARFVSASQIVKGNAVKVSGVSVGSVGAIRLTDDGQADVELKIADGGYAPLRRGTRAIIRQSSLSGIANRYVDLQLGGARGAAIPDGGTLKTDSTEAAVDLDQIFNTFDRPARAGTQKSVEFLRDFQAGNEDEANAALRYLNPALSSSSRLFAELNRNTPEFRRFIAETSKLVTDVSARDDVLAGLVRNLATTTSALTSNGQALADGIGLLPNVMRKANTTFVNLRASLDDLTPLVDDAKPIVRSKLIPFMDQLRPFARDAQPAVRDLSATVRRPGADNDLVELLRRQPALDEIATQTAQRNGADRPGALPAAVKALDGATPQLAFLRPYSADLVGWFDDFSTSGAYDALGNFSRAGLELNGFTLGPLLNAVPVPPELRNALLSAGVKIGRNNRCPGSVERAAPDGSNPYKPSPDFNCDASETPIGP
jgi:phospholipid/cholesterol/gamma-HCH transport system substrate-binding protein